MLEKIKYFLHHAIMNHLRLRCPSCAKLYEVDVASISSFSPQFECVGCHSRFTFEFPPEDPQNILPQLIETSESEVAPVVMRMKSCPKCGAMNKPGTTECYSCQVIFERYEKIKRRAETSATISLVDLWQQLVQDFANQDLHQEFINNCQKQNSLEFALKQYHELQKLLGGDVECVQMIKKIEAMLAAKRLSLEFQKNGLFPADKNAVKNISKWERVQLWTPFVVSAVLVLAGMINRSNRNMIGFGIALSMLSLGLLYFIRGRLSLRDFID